jgi:hypothetical protein
MRFVVKHKSGGYYVIDNETNMVAVGPFELRKDADEKAERRNRSDQFRREYGLKKGGKQ